MTTQKLVKKVNVAVYGSLRRGLHNHSLLKDDEFKGQFETEPIYTLIDLGSFPGLLKDGNTSVVMEVFEVDADKLRRLDMLEGYRGPNYEHNMYNREEIDSPFGKTYTYFYNSTSDLIRANATDTGDWKDYIELKKVKFLTREIITE